MQRDVFAEENMRARPRTPRRHIHYYTTSGNRSNSASIHRAQYCTADAKAKAKAARGRGADIYAGERLDEL